MANREWAAQQLRALGFTVPDSRANFLFARSGRIEGKALYEGLKARGILVRHFDAPRIAPFVRITVGTREQMEHLICQIREMEEI